MTGRTLLSLSIASLLASSASAQTVVRVPFVRIETGGPGGTYVRAPFVNLFFPPGPPPVYYAPPPVLLPPGQMIPVPPPPFDANLGPQPQPQPRVAPQPLPPGPIAPNNGEPPFDPDLAPPAPAQAPKAPTLDEFAKSFKPKAGNYEIQLTNPISKQAETVKFSLPGEPRRVRTDRTSIEFVYGVRQYVRIEFDKDGPIVITR